MFVPLYSKCMQSIHSTIRLCFVRSLGQEVVTVRQTDALGQQKKTETPVTWKWCRRVWSFHRQIGLTSCYCKAMTRARLDMHHLTYLTAMPWHHTCIPLITIYHQLFHTFEWNGHWTRCTKQPYRSSIYTHGPDNTNTSMLCLHLHLFTLTSHKHTLLKTVTLFIPYRHCISAT